MSKRKVIYVDKYPEIERKGMLDAVRIVKEALERRFDVYPLFDLSPAISDLIRERRATQGVDALVTHTPYNPGAFSADFSGIKKENLFSAMYSKSLDILGILREEHLDLPILVYTGSYPDIAEQNQDPRALNAKRVLISSGASDVVFKSGSGDWSGDAERIANCLDRLLPQI